MKKIAFSFLLLSLISLTSLLAQQSNNSSTSLASGTLTAWSWPWAWWSTKSNSKPSPAPKLLPLPTIATTVTYNHGHFGGKTGGGSVLGTEGFKVEMGTLTGTRESVLGIDPPVAVTLSVIPIRSTTTGSIVYQVTATIQNKSSNRYDGANLAHSAYCFADQDNDSLKLCYNLHTLDIGPNSSLKRSYEVEIEAGRTLSFPRSIDFFSTVTTQSQAELGFYSMLYTLECDDISMNPVLQGKDTSEGTSSRAP